MCILRRPGGNGNALHELNCHWVCRIGEFILPAKQDSNFLVEVVADESPADAPAIVQLSFSGPTNRGSRKKPKRCTEGAHNKLHQLTHFSFSERLIVDSNCLA